MWGLLMGCGKYIQYIPTYIHKHTWDVKHGHKFLVAPPIKT